MHYFFSFLQIKRHILRIFKLKIYILGIANTLTPEGFLATEDAEKST